MTQQNKSRVRRGQCFPLGATVNSDGVNFSVFSKNASLIELLLYDKVEDARPSQIIHLRPSRNRTFYYWHVFVPEIQAGQIYAYRVHGTYHAESGMRFAGDKVLLDPYGKSVAVPDDFSRNSAQQPGDNSATAMKSVVADLSKYDWEGDQPLGRPYTQTVIYELHVGGFTRHESSELEPDLRGTFAGLTKKIPYLKELGITAVELMPVFQYDDQDAPDGLSNYWGYSPVSFFAPHSGYSSRKDPLGPIDEFRDMVKALHKAGIEIILDVVYNHTGEGDHDGPTYCLKGFENSTYYILTPDKSQYANYSGTGNTLNAANTIVRRLILDSLHYWVEEMHVDGFRFDLASILSRGEDGTPLGNPATLWDIESDPKLASTKLIAEAWDAAGLYQVGSFIGDRWTEWNGKFRDDIRAFIKGDPGMVSELPSRLLASPDLYAHEEREPEQSINFITSHDGFTLNDLVSYDKKHNLANKEKNRDGHDYNLSWNCGIEGPTDDFQIQSLRNRQIKNFTAINLFALGTPMLLMGDEVRRTQNGNNNAYCQDNEISWFDWNLINRHREMYRFFQRMIAIRLKLDVLRGDQGMTLTEFLQQAKIQWHGTELNHPDLGDNSRSVALTILCIKGTCMFHFMLNAYWQALEFELPVIEGNREAGWRRVIDTYLPSPSDICEPANAPLIASNKYTVQERTVVVLVAESNTR